MAYVPGFQHDVFISYARRSDMAKWVTRFKKILEDQLSSTLGGRPALVWMDSRLRVGDDFAEKIQSQLRRTALLIAVISPRYVESQACMIMELHFFQANGTGEVLPILKTPLEADQHLPLPALHLKQFFEDKDWGPDEFEPGEPRFSRLMKQVSAHIRDRLNDRRRKLQKVYLTVLDHANADGTLQRYREQLFNEFEDRGYAILPRQVLLPGDDDLTRRNIEDADIVVYLSSGEVEAGQFQIARDLRKAVVTCSLKTLPSLDIDAELPIVLGTTEWKREVVSRVEEKLTQGAGSKVA
jgi:TIR domain